MCKITVTCSIVHPLAGALCPPESSTPRRNEGVGVGAGDWSRVCVMVIRDIEDTESTRKVIWKRTLNLLFWRP